MRFSDIQGLHDTKVGLIEAVQKGHVAHAQLFTGNPGSASLALALAYISYLNCESPTKDDSCGNCSSCHKNQNYVHPDVHFVFPVSGTSKVPVKDAVSNSFLQEWREFIKEDPYGGPNDWSAVFGAENKSLNISKGETKAIIQKLSLKAFEGGRKVMLIWLPEYMHPAAANGILKILEEPSSGTVFLLVTQDREKLLSTLLSRTQPVNIRPFTQEEIKDALVEQGVAGEDADHIATLAQGNLKQALRLAAEEVEDGGKFFKEWMRLCYRQDLSELVALSEEFHKMAKLTQHSLFRLGLSRLRETLIAHYGDSSMIKLGTEEKEFVRNYSKVVTPDKLEPIVQIMTEAWYHLERNASAKMVFLDLSINISSLLRNPTHEVAS